MMLLLIVNVYILPETDSGLVLLSLLIYGSLSDSDKKVIVFIIVRDVNPFYEYYKLEYSTELRR